MHKDIYETLGMVAKLSDKSMTRLILEALAAKFGFTLDETGNPVGLDPAAVARQAFAKTKQKGSKKA